MSSCGCFELDMKFAEKSLQSKLRTDCVWGGVYSIGGKPAGSTGQELITYSGPGAGNICPGWGTQQWVVQSISVSLPEAASCRHCGSIVSLFLRPTERRTVWV